MPGLVDLADVVEMGQDVVEPFAGRRDQSLVVRPLRFLATVVAGKPPVGMGRVVAEDVADARAVEPDGR